MSNNALKVLVNKGHEIRQARNGDHKMMTDAINLAEQGDASVLLDLIILESIAASKSEMLEQFNRECG
jgi:hypothetical protein